MAKNVKFDTSFSFGANAAGKAKKAGGGKAKKAGGKPRKPSGIRIWKGQTFGS